MKRNFLPQEVKATESETLDNDLPFDVSETPDSLRVALPSLEYQQTYRSWLLGNTPHASETPENLSFDEEGGVSPEMLENEALAKQRELEVLFELIKEKKLDIPEELDIKYNNLKELIKSITRTVGKMGGEIDDPINQETIKKLQVLFSKYVPLVSQVDEFINTTFAGKLDEVKDTSRVAPESQTKAEFTESEKVTKLIIGDTERMLSALNTVYFEQVRKVSEAQADTLVELRGELLERLRELRLYLRQNSEWDEQALSVLRHNTYKAGLAIKHFINPVPLADSEMSEKDVYNEEKIDMKESFSIPNTNNRKSPEEEDPDLTYIYTNYAERPTGNDAEEVREAVDLSGEEMADQLESLHRDLEVFNNYPVPPIDPAEITAAQEVVPAGVDQQQSNLEVNPAVAAAVGTAAGISSVPTGPERINSTESVKRTVEEEAYQNLRKEWLASKKEHEAAQAAYTEQVKEHYASLQDRNIFAKSWDRMKATVGIKPKLPASIETVRAEMFASTAKYNELADKMRQVRSEMRPGKDGYVLTPSLNDPAIQERIAKGEISEAEIRRMKVADRYFRMLSRSTMMNTFNAQLEAQNEATDKLAIKANGKLLKYRKPLIWLGAGTIGAATGGLAAGGLAVARMVAGGAAASAVTGWLTPKLDGYVENVARMSDEQFNEVVANYDTRLRAKSLTGEEREQIYTELQSILGKVDKAKRDRVLALMGAAAVTGFAFGAGTGQIMDAFDIGGAAEGASLSDATKVDGGGPSVGTGEGTPQMNLDGILAEPEAIPDGSLEQSPGGYAAQPGDNMWDILEGQTEAGKLPFLEQIDPDKLQATLKAVELHLDSNPDLATEIGFRGDPDIVMIGDQIDLDKLNALALEMAEQKGYLLAEGAELPEGVSLEVEQPTYEIEGDLEGGGNELPPGVDELKIEPPTYEIAEDQGAVVNGSGEGIAPANETTTKLTEKVAAKYDTPAAFEFDFTNQFVHAVEGRPTAGIFSFFSETIPSVGALSILEHVDKATLSSLELMSEAERASELDKLGLTEAQYDAWKTYIDYAVSNEEFPAKATFGDILRIKYLDGTLPPANK